MIPDNALGVSGMTGRGNVGRRKTFPMEEIRPPTPTLIFGGRRAPRWVERSMLRAGTDDVVDHRHDAIAIALCAGVPRPPDAGAGQLGIGVPSRCCFYVGDNLFRRAPIAAAISGRNLSIARGSSPPPATLGALLASPVSCPIESPLQAAPLVSGGIISLAFQGQRLGLHSLPYALGTRRFIAAYSVARQDGSAVPVGRLAPLIRSRCARPPGPRTRPIYAIARDSRSLIRGPRKWVAAETASVRAAPMTDQLRHVAGPTGPGPPSRNQRPVRRADRPPPARTSAPRTASPLAPSSPSARLALADAP